MAAIAPTSAPAKALLTDAIAPKALPPKTLPPKVPTTPISPEVLKDLQASGLSTSLTQKKPFLSAFIVGTAANDTLTGSWQNDFIFGLGGNDRIYGFWGNDWLFGGSGDDALYGGVGNDRLYGGAGSDLMYGGTGNDWFRDTSGGNLFNGGSGNDTVSYTGTANPITLKYDVDLVDTGNGGYPDIAVDVLRVYQDGVAPDELESVEVLVGPAGQPNTIDFQSAHIRSKYSPLPPTQVAPTIDVDLSQNSLTFEGTTMSVQNFQNVIGSRGDDTLKGNNLANTLDGNLGSNELQGLGGDDVLQTFEDDTLIGGAGADDFVLRAAWRSRVVGGGWIPGGMQASQILDFESGVDTLQLNASGGAGFQTGSNSFVQYHHFDSLTVGALDPALFYVLGSGTPAPTERHIQYDSTTGDLFYTGIMGSGISKFATLQGAPTLSASDFEVV